MDENIVSSLEAGCCISELINAKIEEHRIKHCPSCNHHIECHEALRDWPGLPAGVKFDPTDQELIEHLRGKVGVDNCGPHPLLDDFIPTIQGQDGICYTHPEKLPGITRDGMIRHFFHRPSKAYTTGNRKRRKIQTRSEEEEGGETRWHKTGKTRPVLINGEQKGCKKILVLYTNFGKHRKPEKTNWVMHQYHLGHQEEETDGELVVSKVFYQTHPRSSCSFNHVNNNAVAIAFHSHSHSTIAYNDIDEPVTMDVEGEAEDKRWSPEESANEEMMNGQQVKEHCNYKNLLCKEHVDVEGGLFGHHLNNGGAAVSSEASDPEEFGLVVTREKDDDRSSPTTSSITTSHSKDLAFQEEIEQEEQQQQQQAATTTEWLEYSLLWAEPDTHNTWDLSAFRND